jgi:hypothetical protein
LIIRIYTNNYQLITRKRALASLPSEGRAGVALGSIGQSALFGYFLGKQKVTKAAKKMKYMLLNPIVGVHFKY